MQFENDTNNPKIIHHSRRKLRINESSNTVLFIREISSKLIPHHGGKSLVHINGEEREKERFLKTFTYIAKNNSYNLEYLIPLIIYEIAAEVASSGCCLYEIVHQHDNFFDLRVFYPEEGYRIPGHFMQIIPRRQWGKYNKNIILIPNKEIWCVKMPKQLGGERGHKKNLNRLEIFDWRNVHPDNSSEYRKLYDVYRQKVANLWGWNFNANSSDATYFFNAYNQVTLSWASAVFREHIINEINNLLKRLKIECSLQVEGLPTSTEILDTRSKLLDGSIDFKAAQERTSIF